MNEYIIVGDTEKYTECLVSLGGTKEQAEAKLERMLNKPNDNDLKLIKGHTNLRIKEVKKENAWWNDPFLAN